MSVIPAARKSYASAPFPEDYWEACHFPVLPPSFHPELTSLPFVGTKIDWKETPATHVFRIDLPGTRKEQVKVDLENGRVLRITWEMCVEKEDRVNRWNLIKHSSRRFVRSILLPEDSKPHEVKACMEDGVLTIQVPRIEMRNGTAHIAIRWRSFICHPQYLQLI